MYWKYVDNGIIVAIGVGNINTTISESEYQDIKTAIKSLPIASEGKLYVVEDKTLSPVLIDVPQEDEYLSDTEIVNIIIGGAS